LTNSGEVIERHTQYTRWPPASNKRKNVEMKGTKITVELTAVVYALVSTSVLLLTYADPHANKEGNKDKINQKTLRSIRIARMFFHKPSQL